MPHVFLVFFLCGVCLASTGDSYRKYDPDMDLTTPQIIRRHGYPSEAHVVATEDGYLLTLHRIPYGKYTTKRGKAVFLQHGLLSSSSDWVLMGPNKSLGNISSFMKAYILADNGFDVWMGNTRGNIYSSGHITLSEHDLKYWNFTWHEMAVFDLPAAIDYILENVNQKSLYYIGHSMGTTMFFAMASTRPEYGLKVKLMFAMAPVAYLSHIKSPIRILAPWAGDMQFIANHLGEGAFLPNNEIIKDLAKYGCEAVAWEEEICTNIMFIMAGFDRLQFNMTMLPLILSHTPAGSSAKTVVHYAQEVNSGKFQQFDYGKEGNLMKYGTEKPPQYNLSAVQTPVSLHYGDNDWLASQVDVQQLYEGLTRKIGKFLVKFSGFNHVDFIYGKDVKTLVYDQILKMLKKPRHHILRRLIWN